MRNIVELIGNSSTIVKEFIDRVAFEDKLSTPISTSQPLHQNQ